LPLSLVSRRPPKTALVEALQRHGYACVPDLGAAVVRQQPVVAGHPTDTLMFADIIVSAHVNAHTQAMSRGTGVVFFDGGIPDIVAQSSTPTPATATSRSPCRKPASRRGCVSCVNSCPRLNKSARADDCAGPSWETMDVYLETERLLLRRFTDADLDLLVDLDSDPDVMRYLTGRPTPREEYADDLLPFYLDYYDRHPGFGFWPAIEKMSGEFVGWFHFRPRKDVDPTSVEPGVELGYRLRKAFWGRGYGTEGSIALIHKGFTELGVQRVWAGTMWVNNASRRVMEKAGLRFVRRYEEDFEFRVPGSEHGEVEYAVTKTNWTEPRLP
jgi:RimJ/RimL family protein N-acetyltransferase